MTNNNNGLWLALVGVGLIADRPQIPNVPPGVGAVWIANDGDGAALSTWNGDKWTNGGASLGTSIAVTGNITSGLSVSAPVLNLTPTTFANKPAVPAVGELVYFTDLSAATIGTVAAAGGANHALCAWDGAAWRIGGVPAQS